MIGFSNKTLKLIYDYNSQNCEFVIEEEKSDVNSNRI